MLSEGGEGVGEVLDEAMGRGGGGCGAHVCHDVVVVGQEGVS